MHLRPLSKRATELECRSVGSLFMLFSAFLTTLRIPRAEARKKMIPVYSGSRGS